MKNKINLRIGLLLLLLCGCINCSRDKDPNPQQVDTISFYSTPELYDLTKEWAGVFSKLNPEVQINVHSASSSSVAENMDKSRNVSFVSGDFDSEIHSRTLWKLVVGRDVVVPIIHAGNPLANEIYQQGISPAEFSRIIQNPGTVAWGDLVDLEHQAPVKLYFTEKAASHPGLAKFLDTDQLSIDGVYLVNKTDLLASVQSDKYAIGICNLTDIIDANSKSIIEGVNILPIDNNANGTIDYKEDVYADLNTFSRGVWIGKYPRELSSNIYSVAASNPGNDSEIAFLKWIITRGQVLLDNHGFSNLEHNERMAQIKWIDSFDVGSPGSNLVPEEPGFVSRPLPIILAIFLLVLLASIWINYLIRRKRTSPAQIQVPAFAFNEDVVKSLPGLYYDKSHTWAFMDKDGLVKVGIDDFLQHVTGPLTRIKMKSTGERIRKGRQAVSIIQDGKQLEISAPISGIIREYNNNLTSNTSLINSSPYTKGWVYKIEPTNWLKEVQFLIMEKGHREWLKKEFRRLKEFIMDSVSPGTVEYTHVLQDGGELKDRILEELGPEVWEDFQTNFIDISS